MIINNRKTKHIKMMEIALNEADKAQKKGEIPIGAVLVKGDKEVLAAEHNQTITLNDPTAHAEILTLRKAALRVQNYRLLNTTLYVTIEPCLMCMGSLVHARVSKIIFGAKDPKWGAAGSLYNFANDPRLNHHPKIIAGICKRECASLIRNFFRSKKQFKNFR